MARIDPRSLDVLQAALERPAKQRTAFIQRECGADRDLLATLHRLLELDATGSLPLDRPIDALAADLFTEAHDDAIAPGQSIGR